MIRWLFAAAASIALVGAGPRPRLLDRPLGPQHRGQPGRATLRRRRRPLRRVGGRGHRGQAGSGGAGVAGCLQRRFTNKRRARPSSSPWSTASPGPSPRTRPRCATAPAAIQVGEREGGSSGHRKAPCRNSGRPTPPKRKVTEETQHPPVLGVERRRGLGRLGRRPQPVPAVPLPGAAQALRDPRSDRPWRQHLQPQGRGVRGVPEGVPPRTGPHAVPQGHLRKSGAHPAIRTTARSRFQAHGLFRFSTHGGELLAIRSIPWSIPTPRRLRPRSSARTRAGARAPVLPLGYRWYSGSRSPPTSFSPLCSPSPPCRSCCSPPSS